MPPFARGVLERSVTCTIHGVSYIPFKVLIKKKKFTPWNYYPYISFKRLKSVKKVQIHPKVEVIISLNAL